MPDSEMDAVFTFTNEAIIIHDGEGRVLRVNPAAEALLGLAESDLRQPAETVEGLVLDASGAPLSVDQFPTRRALASQAAVRNEVIGLRRPDSTLLWAQVSVVPAAFDGDGRITRLVTTYSDVTTTITASRELAEIIDAIPESVMLWEPPVNSADPADFVLVEANGAARAELGVERPIGMSASEVPNGRHYQDLIRVVVENGEPARGDDDRLNREGVYYARRAIPMKSTAGLRVLISSHDIAERVRLQRRLAVSQRQAEDTAQQLNGILQSATAHAIIATSVDGTITMFNEGAERMFQRPASELVGRTSPAALLDPDVYADGAGRIVAGNLWSTSGSDSPDGQRQSYVRADGRKIMVEMTVTPMRDRYGVTVGFIGIGTDVTAAVEATQEVQTQSERWALLFDALPGVAVLEIEEVANGEYQAISSRTSSPIQNQAPGPSPEAILDLLDLQQLPVLSSMYATALEGHEQVRSFRHPDGWYAELSARPLDPVNGRRRLLVVVRDSTAERERDQALAKAEADARFERMFAEAPTGVLMNDLDGTILSANRSLCLMLGQEYADVIGRNVQDFGLPLVGDRGDHVVLDSRGPHTHYSTTEVSVHRPDGTFADLALQRVMLYDADDEPESVLMHVTDVSERRQFEQQLAHMADHDPLTDLFNRRRFDEELSRHLELGERYGPQGALIMLDLDHFKQINDTLGHSVGDDVIVSTASVLRRRLRSTDVVARLGGDEFAVLLTVGDRKQAESTAAKLVKAIRDEVTVPDGSRQRRVSTSLGVVLINKKGLSNAEVVSHADLAMYDAKDAGRNTFSLLDLTESAETRTGARTAWIERIEAALAEDRFVVRAQPILDLHSGQIESAELLVRMISETGEEIMPDRFLHVAERLGAITEIDEWVIDQAIDLLAQIQPENPTFRLEVNLSGKSVGNARLSEHIQQRLASSRIDPSGLVMEITETAAVSDIHAAQAFAEELQRLGCRFALDDFGAGFGSFYYLKHLPFDYLKIDGEFVAKCASNPADQLILSSIVALAKGMNKETIAEFVGDVVTLDTVTRAGVDHAQGYWVGEPLPVEELRPMARPTFLY